MIEYRDLILTLENNEPGLKKMGPLLTGSSCLSIYINGSDGSTTHDLRSDHCTSAAVLSINEPKDFQYLCINGKEDSHQTKLDSGCDRCSLRVKNEPPPPTPQFNIFGGFSTQKARSPQLRQSALLVRLPFLHVDDI
jgi:hypothetical protein